MVHCSNLQKLVIEMYECTTEDISPAVFSEFFTIKEINYDLRIKNLYHIPKAKYPHMGKAPYCLEVVFFGALLSDSIK